MDSLTHLVAGGCIPLAFKRTPKLWAMVFFGFLAGSFPDLDIVFGFGTPIGFLDWHRGYSHALILQPVFAVFLATAWYLFFCRRYRDTPYSRALFSLLTLRRLCWMGLFALVLHVFLDCMTTFGTQIFLPFSSYRVGFPALFIVDPLYTVPALIALSVALRMEGTSVDGREDFLAAGMVVFSPKAVRLARYTLGWLIVYPLLMLVLQHSMVASYDRIYAGEAKANLLPDPLSPVLWKLVLDTGAEYRIGSVTIFDSGPATDLETYAKADLTLYSELEKQQDLFAYFRKFAPDLIQKVKPLQAGKGVPEGSQEYRFIGTRYVMSPNGAAHWVNRTDANFVLEARVAPDNTLLAYRFLGREKDQDEPWLVP